MKENLALAVSYYIPLMSWVAVWVLGNKNPRGWLIHLSLQPFWVLLGFLTGSWGFTVVGIPLFVPAQIRNYRKWRREERSGATRN